MVGTASWGPVGQPVIVATMADYARNFGPLLARKYDMGTHVATAVQQGAANFRCVRVTDGTDTAASLHSCPTPTSCSPRSTPAASATPINVALDHRLQGRQLAPDGRRCRACRRRCSTTSPAPAPRSGSPRRRGEHRPGPQRGPSQLVVANAGSTTAAPAAFAWSFASGDAGQRRRRRHQRRRPGRRRHHAAQRHVCAARPGLQHRRCWPTPTTSRSGPRRPGSALSEGIYMILAGPAGDTIANAVCVKQSVGPRHLRRQADVRRLDLVERPGQPGDAPGQPAGLRRRPAGQPVARAVQPEQAALRRRRHAEIRRRPAAARAPPIPRAELGGAAAGAAST